MREHLKQISPSSFINHVPVCLKDDHVSVEYMFPILENKPANVECLADFLKYISTYLDYRMRRPNVKNNLFILCFDKIESKFEHDKKIPTLDEFKLNEKQDAFINWKDYLKNDELVTCELYPIIFNYLLKNFVPFQEEQLILHGLPGNWKYENKFENHPLIGDFEGIPVLCNRLRITKRHKLKDPDIFNHVFVFTGMNKYRWEDAKNNVQDGKAALLSYWRFFPGRTFVIFSNDEDVLAMALLHTFDRWTNKTFCQTEVWIRSLLGGLEFFININQLFLDILEHDQLKKTQNPILTVAFAIATNLDREEVEILLKNTIEFSHIVQSTLSISPDPCQWRDVILDDEAYIEFYHLCFLKTNKENPEDTELKRRGRRVLFKLLRYFNAYRPNFEDEPKKLNPVYGFNAGEALVDQKNVDDVYKRHFFTEIKKRKIKKKCFF
jgi:hypothetical protein